MKALHLIEVYFLPMAEKLTLHLWTSCPSALAKAGKGDVSDMCSGLNSRHTCLQR